MSERMNDMTITEFLLARVAEDEADWRVVEAREEVQLLHGEPLALKMLLECEAKRRIMNLMEALMGHEKTYFERMRHTKEQDDVYVIARTALRTLASVYADHPDFDDSWRATAESA